VQYQTLDTNAQLAVVEVVHTREATTERGTPGGRDTQEGGSMGEDNGGTG